MKSFPFDSAVTYDEAGNPVYDRGYNSQELRAFFHLLYTDGVFPAPATGLKVVAYSQEMSVQVLPGSACIQGALGIEENARTLVFEASGEAYDRIDAVVARLDTNYEKRKIDIYVVKGMEAASPVAPELVRQGGIYELRLANVFIAKNTTMISTERITDTRLNAEDCGIVTSNPERVDTSPLFDQYQAALASYLKYVEECIDGTTAGALRAQLGTLKTQLGTTDISNIGDGTITGALASLNTHTGRIGKLLFSRSYANAFSEGAIEIPDISDYKVFIGYFQTALVSPMIGISTGSNIIFTGSIITSTTEAAVGRTILGISDDTLTFIKGYAILGIWGLDIY